MVCTYAENDPNFHKRMLCSAQALAYAHENSNPRGGLRTTGCAAASSSPFPPSSRVGRLGLNGYPISIAFQDNENLLCLVKAFGKCRLRLTGLYRLAISLLLVVASMLYFMQTKILFPFDGYFCVLLRRIPAGGSWLEVTCFLPRISGP